MMAAKVGQKATLAEQERVAEKRNQRVPGQLTPEQRLCFPEDTQRESAEAGSGWQRVDCCAYEDGVDVAHWLLSCLRAHVEHLIQSPVQAPLYVA